MVQSRNDRNLHFLVGGVCTIALGIRLLPLLRSGNEWALMPDSFKYIALARGMRMGCGFAAEANGTCGAAEIFRTPGYPALLALLPSLRSVVAVQAVMGALICLLLVGFIWPRWGWKAAAMAGVLFAFDVTSVETGSMIANDTLFAFLLTAAVIAQLWIVSRGVLDGKASLIAVGAALLLGLDALVRPIGQLLILAAPLPVLMIGPAFRRKQVAMLAATLGIALGVNLAWMTRNWVHSRMFTVSAEAGFQLYFHRAAESVWLHRGASLQARSLFDAQDYLYDQLCSTHPGYCIPYVRVATLDRNEAFENAIADSCRNSGRFTCSEFSNQAYRVMWRRGLVICAHHPAAVGVVTLASLGFMALNPYDSGLYHLLAAKRIKTGSLKNRYAEALGAPSVAALTLLNGVLLVFTWAGVGLCLWRLAHRNGWHDANLVLYPLMLALVLMALSAGPLEAIQMRFRLPATPFLAMIAAIGWFGPSHDYLG
jgi:hypothetical protein